MFKCICLIIISVILCQTTEKNKREQMTIHYIQHEDEKQNYVPGLLLTYVTIAQHQKTFCMCTKLIQYVPIMHIQQLVQMTNNYLCNSALLPTCPHPPISPFPGPLVQHRNLHDYHDLAPTVILFYQSLFQITSCTSHNDAKSS